MERFTVKKKRVGGSYAPTREEIYAKNWHEAKKQFTEVVMKEVIESMEQVIENLYELSNCSDDYHVESKLACLGGRAVNLLNELKELEN